MAANFKIQSLDPVNRPQLNGVANPHSSGDLCYEQGFYGIAEDSVDAGGSFRMQIRCVVNLPVPGGVTQGQLLHCGSKPAGAITLATSGAVTVAMVKTAPDANNYADVQLLPDLSMGN